MEKYYYLYHKGDMCYNNTKYVVKHLNHDYKLIVHQKEKKYPKHFLAYLQNNEENSLYLSFLLLKGH